MPLTVPRMGGPRSADPRLPSQSRGAVPTSALKFIHSEYPVIIYYVAVLFLSYNDSIKNNKYERFKACRFRLGIVAQYYWFSGTQPIFIRSVVL